MFTLALESNVQICKSLFKTSTCAPQSISAAFISFGPLALICIFLCFQHRLILRLTCLIFKIISVTSSITPGIEENS